MSSMSRRGPKGLRVSVTDVRGRALRSLHASGLAAWLSRAAPATTSGVVSVAIVSDADMRRLNRNFRGVNRATDVLSFPAKSARARTKEGDILGDLAIARGVAARQARACGHSLATEIRTLALHGLLHLLGYDHETDRGRMARIEERLRRRAGLTSGLIGRGYPRRTRI